MTELVNRIHALEASYKCALAQSTLAELTKWREQLCDLLLHKTKAALTKCKRYFYEHNNKCGKALARSLRSRLTQSYIPEIRDNSGNKASLPKEMGKVFRDYSSSFIRDSQHLRKIFPGFFQTKDRLS